MSTWIAGKITAEAARQIQVKVGQKYETEQLAKFLNRVYEDAWNFHDWQQLIQIDSLALAVNDNYLVLPKKYSRLLFTFSGDADGSTKRLNMLRYQKNQHFINETTSLECAFMGERGVLVQPAAAAVVAVKSSSSADVGVKVRVEGECAGVPVAETITTDAADGTTLTSGSVQFDVIDRVTKNNPKTTGYITVSNAAGTITYATIATWESTPYYSWYQLDGKQTAVSTIWYVAKKRFVPMTSTLSAPFMDGLGPVLVDGVVFLASAEFEKMDIAGDYLSMMTQRLNKLIENEQQPADEHVGRF